MLEFFTYDFMKFALILGLAIGISGALLSPFLVLNHQAMIADGLSHVAFSGIIFGLLLMDEPLYFAIIFTVLASFAITYLGQLKMIEYDSAIGVVSAFSLAIGLITIHLSSGFNRSIESLLVGSIVTVTPLEVIISLSLLAIVLAFVVLFYRPLLSLTYDPIFAQFSKIRLLMLKYILSALTATLIVVGVRTVGMLLMSSFVIFPSLIASQVARSFKKTMIYSTLIAAFTIFSSIILAYYLDVPTGGTIVVLYVIILSVFLAIRKIQRRY